MFTYCLNNPVNYVDASGTASKSCLHDFTEPESPWKDSGSGGGRPYRNYSSSSNYYGEVADKFYSVRLFKAASNGLKIGAKWLWEAYKHSNELQVQQKYQHDMTVKAHWEDAFSTPSRLGDFASMTFTNATAYASYAALATATTVTTGGVVVVAFTMAFAIRSTLQYYNLLPEISWEDLVG